MLLYQNKRDSDFSVVSIPGDGGKCALFSGIVEIIAVIGLFKRIMYRKLQMEVQN